MNCFEYAVIKHALILISNVFSVKFVAKLFIVSRSLQVTNAYTVMKRNFNVQLVTKHSSSDQDLIDICAPTIENELSHKLLQCYLYIPF